MIRSEAKASLARKLDIDLANISRNGLFTEADLEDYIQTGARRAWDYKPWPFAEKTESTTTFGAGGYNSYPVDFEDESISRLRVNGIPFVKKNWDDYNGYFYEFPNDSGQMWSEHQRFYFINPNAVPNGATITVTGKVRAPALTSDTDLMPFSPDSDNSENSGNQAIVQLAFAEALGSEKLKNYGQAAAERKDAYGVLNIIWKPFGQRKSNETGIGNPMFQVPDYFGPQQGHAGEGVIANFRFY